MHEIDLPRELLDRDAHYVEGVGMVSMNALIITGDDYHYRGS